MLPSNIGGVNPLPLFPLPPFIGLVSAQLHLNTLFSAMCPSYRNVAGLYCAERTSRGPDPGGKYGKRRTFYNIGAKLVYKKNGVNFCGCEIILLEDGILRRMSKVEILVEIAVFRKG